MSARERRGTPQRVGDRGGRARGRTLNLYLDASALVKRYIAEEGSEDVRRAMATSEHWHICRVGFIETWRAITLGADPETADRFRAEWAAFAPVEVDALLADHAAELAVTDRLHSLDALHLASALMVGADVVAAWDVCLAAAARRHGLTTIPDAG